MARARLGDFSDALASAKEIGAEPWKSIALMAVARAQAATGKGKEAEQTIEILKASSSQIEGLCQLALGQAQGGDGPAARRSFDEAIALVKDLPVGGKRSGSLHCIASAQALTGDFPGAFETAKQLFSPRSGSIIFANIAHAQAKAGDIRAARETAERFPEGTWWRGNAFRSIARMQTEQGHPEEALEWIRQLPSSFDKAHALLGVAESLKEPRGFAN